MALKRNVLSSLIPGFDPRLFIGFHFHPTYEDGIRIVEIKNAGEELLPIFKEDDDLFRRPPEEIEECYCFTKLKPAGKNKVNRKLQEGSDRRFWKNINRPEEVVVNDNIGCVTKLRLYEDKNTPTEWHILEYRDRKTPDAGRWVLCKIYKREKNTDPSASDIGAGQIIPYTPQVSSMNKVQHYEMGQCADTPNAATLTGEHMNQDQIPGVGQYLYPPPGDVVYSPQQFTSNNTYSNGGIDTYSVFIMDDWNGLS